MAAAQQNGYGARETLERVLCSACFTGSKGQSRLLRYLVERQLAGRENELKESLIGVEVYGRKPDYDPKRDATVRSEAARLRARLSKYYASEGLQDRVVIELPKGGYVPRFRLTEATATADKAGFKRLWLVAALAVLAVAVAALVDWWARYKNAPIAIAVLPLVNLSQDAGNEYFADALTVEIIRNLTIIDGLTVRSQTSSFAFKGNPKNMREAGRQLDVDYILEGSVLRTGKHLRIDTQLVRVRDDFAVWSARYDRQLTDLAAIQDEISRGMVNSLRLKFGRGQRRYDTNTEAYDLYLRARALGTRATFQGSLEIIRLFEQSVAKDPSLAPAYAGLAMAYAWRSGINPRESDHDEMSAKLRAAAEKAIQTDPLLAEAHSALGMACARNGQWALAERSFRRALEIDPNSSATHDQFARFFYWPLGRIEEAAREMRAAVRGDPLSQPAHFDLGDLLPSAGRYEEAAAECERVPADSYCLGRVRTAQGRTDEAVRLLATNENWGYLAYAYAKAGQREKAEKLMAVGPMLHPNNGGHFQYALAFAGFADRDRTIGELEAWTSVGPVRMGFTLNTPEFAFLRGDSRLKALRKRVGLPE
jgi:TolB-like protein